VDGSGTWSVPVQGVVVNAHPPDVGHNIGPGQTVTGLVTFQVTGVTQILYNGAGFVVNAQGDPVNGGSAYYEGSWTAAAEHPSGHSPAGISEVSLGRRRQTTAAQPEERGSAAWLSWMRPDGAARHREHCPAPAPPRVP
jgi:hypothetical protein